MLRTWLKLEWFSVWRIQFMPGDREKELGKDLKYSYQDPAQVPLGEKPKVWRFNLVEGIRQISPVASV